MLSIKRTLLSNMATQLKQSLSLYYYVTMIEYCNVWLFCDLLFCDHDNPVLEVAEGNFHNFCVIHEIIKIFN